ncbi:hypothetical protein FOXB_05089, partial [Fusarium oxysporum f. sp. conglutinans Fo5176]|jgi:predicted RNase H-like HicB family nuclease
LKLR